MTCELDVVDYFGRRVRLDHSNWQKHKPVHPEVVPYHDEIPAALTDPEVVIEAQADGAYHFYRRGIGQGRLSGAYLRVIVVYDDPDAGKIRTCYFTRSVDPQGQILAFRPQGWRKS